MMALNKTNKKWYCNTCIKPEIVETPYILTQEEIASISLKCKLCGETYITRHKTVLLEHEREFLCQKCSTS